jgi:hypothetical protein
MCRTIMRRLVHAIVPARGPDAKRVWRQGGVFAQLRLVVAAHAYNAVICCPSQIYVIVFARHRRSTLTCGQ